jgi:RNA polymerase sigma-70 factor, ECF subfamily
LGDLIVALSDIDRNLLDRCIARKPRAWEDFVDRFMGLVLHVIDHTARSRGILVSPEDREDLCAQVFLEMIKNEFGVLRHFRRQSSLATYLTVVARRVAVNALVSRRAAERVAMAQAHAQAQAVGSPALADDRFADRDEIERLLQELDASEADAVRMYHLEGKSYQEIGSAVGISENSVGPLLSRAREKMRRAAERSPS